MDGTSRDSTRRVKYKSAVTPTAREIVRTSRRRARISLSTLIRCSSVNVDSFI